MRRRDFLKGLSAVFGAAVLPVAATASLTSGISTTHYLVDGKFISVAEIDDNAFRELRRLLHEARGRFTNMTPKAVIDVTLYDRVMRRLNAMERLVVGQSYQAYGRNYGQSPIFIDGTEVLVDVTMEYLPGGGHLVKILAISEGSRYYARWEESITPATLTARPGSSVASTAPHHPK